MAAISLERASIERAMQGWCRATGMAPWNAEDDVFAMLGATPVCIHFRTSGGNSAMHVLAALGTPEPLPSHARLLQLNFDPGSPGCYGVRPDSDEVFFRVVIDLESHADPDRIHADLHSVIETARSLLAAH